MTKEKNPPPPPKNSDVGRWEKIKILSKFATPIVVAVLGFFFTRLQAQKNQQAIETEIYTKLLASREAAESALRKDLFPKMVEAFFTEAPATEVKERLLNLELMAGNFHDSVNLRPLFSQVHMEITKEIKDTNNSEMEEEKRKEKLTELSLLQERLDRLSTNIREIQLAVVMESKQINTGTCEYEKYLDVETGEVKNPDQYTYELELDDYLSNIHLAISNIDPDRKEARIRVIVDTYKAPEEETPTTEPSNGDVEKKDDRGLTFPGEKETFDKFKSNHAIRNTYDITRSKAEFWVGAYDFPMISNMRLPNNQRCAIVLNEIDPDKMTFKFSVVLFRGRQASLKEKVYIDELIRKLLHKDDVIGL